MKRSATTVILSAIAVLSSMLPAHAAGYTTLVPTDQAQAPAGTVGDGRVWAVVYLNGIAYLGGDFTAIVDHGGNVTPRQHLAAINLSTGHVTGWNPGADGPVWAMATDGTSIFAGGDFKTAAGESNLGRLQSITTAGTATANWNVKPGFFVRDLLEKNGTLYIAGDFAKVNGIDRERVAAVDADTGTLLSFQASITNGASAAGVRSIAINPAGDTLYIGGYFTHVNGQAEYHMGALDAVTGASKPWAFNPVATAYPDDMEANKNGVFAGFAAKGTDFHGTGSFSLVGGTVRWTKRTCGDTQDIALIGATMYIGGHLRCILNIATDPRTGLGAMKQSNGAILPWNPTANMGCPAGCLGVWDLTKCGTDLCVGGDFSKINGDDQAKFALLR